MSAWQRVSLIGRQDWASGLATFRLSAGPQNYEPGQFVNLALQVGEERLKRAYSLASAPGDEAQFLVSLVEQGAFTPRLFGLHLGDELEIETRPSGFFTPRWLPDFARDLWLIASGTGLGPFIAMLRDPTSLARFERVVVVHSVRYGQHLAYQAELSALVARDERIRYVPVVTREGAESGASGLVGARIPSLVRSGKLEERAQVALAESRSHVMLCGNPEMIRDASLALNDRGLRRHRQREPGHITTENYW